MDHRVVKATKLYKAELLHSDSFPSSIASGHSHNPIYKNIYKNIFYYDCSLCLIAFVDAVCKDKTKPTCTSLVWKVRKWADAYGSSKLTLYIVFYRFEWDIWSETGYAAKTSRNFGDQTLTFKSECPSTSNGT